LMDKDASNIFKQTPSLLNDASYQPQVINNVPAPKLGKIKRDKYSSTATMFMNKNILAPDVAETVKCLSVALYWMIQKSLKVQPRVFKDVFSEETNPLGDNKTDFATPPTTDEVHEFLGLIFEAEELSAECAVMSLVYIERLVALTNITLHASNWRRICLGAIIVASKVWEDCAVWNVDFQSAFPGLNAADLGKLEREYLVSLQFHVTLKASIYAKYYFDLRSIAERNEKNFPLKPMSLEDAQQLEDKSRGIEANEKRFNISRSQSVDPYKHKDSTASMEIFSRHKKDDD